MYYNINHYFVETHTHNTIYSLVQQEQTLPATYILRGPELHVVVGVLLYCRSGY